MAKKNDLSGKTFGRWTVVKEAPRRGTHSMWECICSCGNGGIVFGCNLVTGISKSCGCINSEVTANRNYKHGLSNHRIFVIWSHMLDRCNNENNVGYHNYGGRGIKVCERWHEFKAFYDDMIDSYQKELTLERIDVNKGYFPENCKWATTKEQGRNRRNNRILTCGDKSMALVDWAEFLGIPYYLIMNRLKYGWPDCEALYDKSKRYVHKKRKGKNIVRDSNG